MVLTFKSVMKSQSVTIQMKATEHYFPVVLFIMLHKVVLTLVSLIIKYPNEIYCTNQYFPEAQAITLYNF